MEAVQKRTEIIDYLARHIVGPRDGEDESIPQEPHRYYLSGVLFPVKEEDAAEYTADDVDGKCEDSDTVAAEQVSTLSGKIRPSSMGVEFRANRETQINLCVTYATYTEENSNWKRSGHKYEVNLPRDKTVTDFKLNETNGGILRVIQKRAGEDFRYRVFVVNFAKGKKRGTDVKSVIFQPSISVQPEGFLKPFPDRQLNTLHPEDRLMKIQYRKHRIYASAFGCAADWTLDSTGKCTGLRTTYIPQYEIKPLTFETGEDDGILSLNRLSYGLMDEPDTIVKELEQFVEFYKQWIKEQPKRNADLDPDSEPVKEILSRCDEVVQRMKTGIRLLQQDVSIRESFALANLGMLMQFAHKNHDVRPDRKYDIRSDYRNVNHYKWRPFQLAFILISIEPTVNESSLYREICDLIWFPTGGGKTEAYLGVTAFTILHGRRRNLDKAGGTMVLSRYTLRLLTSQQFERTASLICCLEMIRAAEENVYGKTPISLGLWVGQSSTPNRIQQAKDKLDELIEADDPRKQNPFKLTHCPCCNQPLLPERMSANHDEYGFVIQNGMFYIHCTEHNCIFSNRIPVYIIDEDIYKVLPTVVIGTIDKFARLAWVDQAGKILTGNRGEFLPPCLIIQDELHLISGPLGTIAGVYETAIETLCCHNGTKPHLISSTATVRRADDQCMALYGRHVRQFPPPGLDEADSFFSRKDSEADGRNYLGILAPHESDITVSVRLHALALQAPYETDKNSDSYSTLISYFNSLKEMGIANTMAADDIPDRLKVIQPDPHETRPFSHDDFDDLYGEKKIEELDDIMKRLYRTKNDPGFLSLVLTTNIISVGVDVDRLGLMIVNGQPKTTAEYIQATSRVGRTRSVPGLILVKYGAMKPRDRSHYENFIPYHARIYSHVEPTSVTPFSKPSRDRALHAVCVIMMRHLPGGLSGNADASRIAEVETMIDCIKAVVAQRTQITAPDEHQRTIREMNTIFEDWKKWAATNPQRLYYEAGNLRQFESVLHRDIDASLGSPGWNTMDSMRSIDYETRFQIKGDPNG